MKMKLKNLFFSLLTVILTACATMVESDKKRTVHLYFGFGALIQSDKEYQMKTETTSSKAVSEKTNHKSCAACKKKQLASGPSLINDLPQKTFSAPNPIAIKEEK